MKKSSLKVWMASVAILGIVLAACGSAEETTSPETSDNRPSSATNEDDSNIDTDTESDTTELVDFRLGNTTKNPGPPQSPYTVLPAILGFWQDEGLNVEPLPLAGSADAVQALVAGQVDAVAGGPEGTMPAIISGADLITYYNQISGCFHCPGVLEDSPIQSIEDFPGKTVGVSSLQSAAVPTVKAILNDSGIDPESVTFVATGSGLEPMLMLQNGDIDILATWGSMYAEFGSLGAPMRVVAPEEWLDRGFSLGLIASKSALAEDRSKYVGFARGVEKATIFLDENPEAVIRLVWGAVPESKPSGVSEEEAMQSQLLQLEARLEKFQPVDGQWGLVTDETVSTMAQQYFEIGLTDRLLDIDEIWTADLLADINDIDEQEIRNFAQSFDEVKIQEYIDRYRQ